MGFLRGCVSPKCGLTDEEIEKLTTITSMDKDEIEEQHQKFLSHHKNGKISRKSFQNLLQQSCPGLSNGALGKMAQHILRIYDTNQDGNIDFAEFILTLHIMKEGSPEENLKQIFRVFDINCDGAISLKELSKIVKDFRDVMENQGEEVLAKTAFDEMDADHDGKIDEDEFVSACLNRRKASASIAIKIVNLFVTE